MSDHRFYLEHRAVFTTVVTRDGTAPFAGTAAEALLDCMRRCQRRHAFRHLAHVILPDHFHWMLVPESAGDLREIIDALERSYLAIHRPPAAPSPPSRWRSGLHDRVVNGKEDFRKYLDYIHFDPVKHGVVGDPAEYPHSSFGDWRRRGLYPNGWGTTEPPGIGELRLE